MLSFSLCRLPTTDPASGGSPVLVCSGSPGFPEAGGRARQREDGGAGGRGGRQAEPRAGAERQGRRTGAGSPAALGRAQLATGNFIISVPKKTSIFAV